MGLFDEHMAVLREKLRTTDDFSDLFNYFMTHMAENPKFNATLERVEFDMLFGIMERMAKERTGKKSLSLNRRLYIALQSKEDRNFYHGVCGNPTLVVIAFYFEDLSMGLIACSGSAIRPKYTMLYGRFTAIKTDKPKDLLSVTPDQSRRLH
ncbi:MAG: hypothetical protein HQL58_11915 [Magnetococcales bacterium]|nr:hypothetical protein [Magnetococcales bacterium]